ncbi:MAG: DUF3160 domain-containing protein [Candidatus Coatesbacteria bacterium]|nr:DUF3160 domain-containing protein [Candidatus Coatesbacteria bacterium]
MSAARHLISAVCCIAVLITAGSAFGGFKTVMATIDCDVETRFGVYRPLSVDVEPSLGPENVAEDFSNVADFASVADLLTDDAKALLAKNGFVVTPTHDAEVITMQGLYEDLQVHQRRMFVTTDSMLTSYHVLFDYSLRVAEMQRFNEAAIELTGGMVGSTYSAYQNVSDDYIAGLLLKNLAYFSAPAKLLDPDYVVADEVADLVGEELALIEAHEGRACSPIMGYYEDYSQYVPRGHYTRNETLGRYFKAMMWYGRLMFRLEPNSSLNCVAKDPYEETLQALLIVQALASLETASGTGLELYDRIYTPTVFYVGEADDLTIEEYLTLALEVFGETFASIPPEQLMDEEKLSAFTEAAKELHDPLINSTFVQDYEDHATTTKGFRFMGQRFIPDSFVFQQLVHNKVWGRFMPKGLDVMAALGSSRAYSILDFVYQDTRYPGYAERMERLRTWFATLPDASWVQNLYWDWLYCLMPTLVTKGDGFPLFMQNKAWTDKELGTALGSWTELRHDTILYAKQSYSYETGMPDPTIGYVEPNPLVYGRLASLCDMTITGLDGYGLLLADYRRRFENLRDTLLTLKQISEKELVGMALDEDERMAIYNIGPTLSEILSFPKDDPSSQNEEDGKMALVADVHTDGNSSSVLEEAVGHPHYIYVIAPTDDGLAACVGGVYSYYEFAWPMSDRLTDGAWQRMLSEGANPPQPEWMSSFVAEGVSEGQAPPSDIVTIAANDLIVSDGDTLAVSVSISTYNDLEDCTAYVAALDPMGNLLFYPDFSEAPQALDFSMPAGALIKDLPIFQVEVVPWIESGYYVWMAALCDDSDAVIDSTVSISPLLIK